MKELYMEMVEETKRLYREKELRHLELEHQIPYRPIPMDILCPNCMKDKLMYEQQDDIQCSGCGQEFVLVDAQTVRFK